MADPASTTEILLKITSDIEGIKKMQEQFASFQKTAKDTGDSVGHVGDMRLFGFNSGVMLDLLQKLRVDGLEKMRKEAEETGGVLSGDMARALDTANHAAEEALNKLSIRLAPVNLRMAEFKRLINETLAAHAVLVGQLGTGAAFGVFASGLALAASKAMVGLGWAPMGASMGLLFGAAFAVAVGGFLISAIRDAMLEGIEKHDAALASGAGKARDLSQKIEFSNDPKEVEESIAEAKKAIEEMDAKIKPLLVKKAMSGSWIGGEMLKDDKDMLDSLERGKSLLKSVLRIKEATAIATAKARADGEKELSLQQKLSDNMPTT